MNERWKNWALDVSLGHPCFVPILDDGTLVVGFSVLAGKGACFGKLVAVFHQDGQEAVEAWIENHPNWHEDFS